MGQWCPFERRHDQLSCGDGIVVVKAAYAEMPWIMLSNGVPSRWSSLSALHLRTPHTGAILDGRIFALLVREHIWLESGAGEFYSGWDLGNGTEMST